MAEDAQRLGKLTESLNLQNNNAASRGQLDIFVRRSLFLISLTRQTIWDRPRLFKATADLRASLPLCCVDLIIKRGLSQIVSLWPPQLSDSNIVKPITRFLSFLAIVTRTKLPFFALNFSSFTPCTSTICGSLDASLSVP